MSIVNSTMMSFFVDSNDEINNHLGKDEFMEYLEWYFDCPMDSDKMNQKIRLMLFDESQIDVVLYDNDLTYRQYVMYVCKVCPNILTPHIVRQLKKFITENELF